MLNSEKREQKVLKFWQENKIFEKSIRDENSPKFVFYEGPPTANGQPGIHHIEARAFKDIVCRYKNMKGFRVIRKAGWDTHGLPVEIQVEELLKLKDKKEIENYGIFKFNKKCKESVWKYKKDWEEITKRIGFWLNMENPYITYENDYIESVWWILKQIWDKGLLYQDYKIVPFCPRCGTTLSSHELAQGYKKIKEDSVYVKFELEEEKDTYLLVWTTTPWTLPGNVAIAINPNFTYVKVKMNNEFYILAKERMLVLEEEYEIIQEIPGEKLNGIKYKPLYEMADSDEKQKKSYEVLSGDFVTLEDGTGLVHIAPGFGEEDYQLFKEQKGAFAFLITVDKEGNMKTPGYKWDKMFVKKADPLIIDDLAQRNLLFKKELYEHDYPFCWRCDTPLIYYAQSSWFIKMTAVKDKLIENNEKINWVPANLKYGRFGDWIKEVKDWNLSRERYWGTPLPIWQCQNKDCSYQQIIGSIKELKDISKQEISDLHRPYVDEITFKCEKCGGEMKRVLEVIDCWFDSGAMPFAQQHYPFENKELIDENIFYPADFICEGLDQTRGWFYTLLAISTLLDKGASYKNVVVTGLVLDEKGKKMSKSKGNIVVPEEVIGKFGADCIRLYFYTVNQVDQPKRFSFKDVQDFYRKFFLTLENCLSFWQMYAGDDLKNATFNVASVASEDVLDKWIISRLNTLAKKVGENLENYDIVSGARLFLKFVDDLSNWYIRRSRKRFQKPKTLEEKEKVCSILRYVLMEISKLLAPFTPFISEYIYQTLKSKEDLLSVHLNDYPKYNEELINKELEDNMVEAREVVALVLAERVKAGIKVRQPLSLLKISKHKIKDSNLFDLIKEEVNVKEIEVDAGLKTDIDLDITLTEELKKEGQIREIARKIQQMRKEFDVEPRDKVVIGYKQDSDIGVLLRDNKSLIEKDAVVDIVEMEEGDVSFENQKNVKIGDKEIILFLKVIN